MTGLTPVESFRRVAIVNRGEAAMRLVHAAREFGDGDLVTIALHTAAERRAMFVREADEAVCFDDLGVASGDRPTSTSTSSRAALVRGAGRGGLGRDGGSSPSGPSSPICATSSASRSSDRPATSCDSSATRSPPSAWPRQADVPLAPWSGGPVETVEEAIEAAEASRLPADGQGRRRRRRSGHPAGRAPDELAARSSGPAPRARRRSATPRCSSSGS